MSAAAADKEAALGGGGQRWEEPNLLRRQLGERGDNQLPPAPFGFVK